jgi:hypothetical protein
MARSGRNHSELPKPLHGFEYALHDFNTPNAEPGCGACHIEQNIVYIKAAYAEYELKRFDQQHYQKDRQQQSRQLSCILAHAGQVDSHWEKQQEISHRIVEYDIRVDASLCIAAEQLQKSLKGHQINGVPRVLRKVLCIKGRPVQ